MKTIKKKNQLKLMRPHFTKTQRGQLFISPIINPRRWRNGGKEKYNISVNFLEQPLDDFNLREPEEVILYP